MPGSTPSSGGSQRSILYVSLTDCLLEVNSPRLGDCDAAMTE